MIYPETYEIQARAPLAAFAVRAFLIPYENLVLRVLAAEEPEGWEHVSVSIGDEGPCPTWEAMCLIKDMFFMPEDLCIQYHPRKSQYVNIHNSCLHIWRPPSGVAKLLERDS